MTFRPLHDRVAVRRLDSEEKTKGGIIIPDTAKEKPQDGEVIAVGPGAGLVDWNHSRRRMRTGRELLNRRSRSTATSSRQEVTS